MRAPFKIAKDALGNFRSYIELSLGPGYVDEVFNCVDVRCVIVVILAIIFSLDADGGRFLPDA